MLPFEFATATAAQCRASPRGFFAGGLYDFVHYELHQRVHPHRRGMTAVSQTTMARAPQLIAVRRDGFTIAGSQRDVSSVTYITASERDGILYGFLRCLQQEVVAQPRCNGVWDFEPRKVAAVISRPFVLATIIFRRWADVVSWVRAAQLGPDFQFALHYPARQRFDMFYRPRTGAGEAQSSDLNSQCFHEMKDFDFFCDRRIAHRRRLHPSAEFIIQEDWGEGSSGAGFCWFQS